MSLTSTAQAIQPRARLLRRAFLLEVFTISWNLLEGLIATAAGVLAGSVALLGFGVNSFIETASAVVVGWRLREEMLGGDSHAFEEVERKASRIAGALLLLLAGYLVFDAGGRLMGMGRPAQESLLGIIITAVSLVVMPILGWAKLRTARELQSRSLRVDAYETITCAWLSATTLAGLALNAAFGWQWADPLAALLLVPLIVREGLEGWRGEHCNAS